jgi:hypothetical protein
MKNDHNVLHKSNVLLYPFFRQDILSYHVAVHLSSVNIFFCILFDDFHFVSELLEFIQWKTVSHKCVVYLNLPGFFFFKFGQIIKNGGKGNNKITELRTILQRESQNS